jgi:hypothetical protein
MTETPQARPALLTINAVGSAFIGAIGMLLCAFLLFVIEQSARAMNGHVDELTIAMTTATIGCLFIALTMLRWGVAVLEDRPTMAYLPGRAARTGRYGALTGVLSMGVTLIFAAFFYAGGGVTALEVGVVFSLPVVLVAVGMIAFASRIDRGSPDHKQ